MPSHQSEEREGVQELPGGPASSSASPSASPAAARESPRSLDEDPPAKRFKPTWTPMAPPSRDFPSLNADTYATHMTHGKYFTPTNPLDGCALDAMDEDLHGRSPGFWDHNGDETLRFENEASELEQLADAMDANMEPGDDDVEACLRQAKDFENPRTKALELHKGVADIRKRVKILEHEGVTQRSIAEEARAFVFGDVLDPVATPTASLQHVIFRARGAMRVQAMLAPDLRGKRSLILKFARTPTAVLCADYPSGVRRAIFPEQDPATGTAPGMQDAFKVKSIMENIASCMAHRDMQALQAVFDIGEVGAVMRRMEPVTIARNLKLRINDALAQNGQGRWSWKAGPHAEAVNREICVAAKNRFHPTLNPDAAHERIIALLTDKV